jgi:hypothetical protein
LRNPHLTTRASAALLAFALALVGCGTSPTPSASDLGDVSDADPDAAPDDAGDVSATPCPPRPPFADPRDLPEVIDPPPLLAFADGAPVLDEAAWRCRRGELVALLERYEYGRPASPATPRVVGEPTTEDLGDGASLVQVTLDYGVAESPLHLALFLPPGPGPVPVFLALNPCGNHTLHPSPPIRESVAYADPSCTVAARERGGRAARWPVADILGRGYALAAVHQSDIAPDSAAEIRRQGATVALVPAPGDADAPPWGAVAAWAWGLERAVDYLVTDDRVDPAAIIVVGHSRRGKAALLAGALDERIAVVIPHQSGTGGATLSRSYLGESVQAVTAFFPHWFAETFAAFAGRETRLPLDQHMLLALVAPRALLVTNGAEDTWADPPGALAAVRLADAAWELLGSEGMVAGPDPDGAPRLDADLSWHERPGGHDLEPRDWQTFMDFADHHLGR